MKIMGLEYEWPDDVEISLEAKDLIERLIKIEPKERLGAGQPGTPNDLTQLQRHPYFANVAFD